MKIKVENPPHNIRELCEQAFDLTGTEPVWTFKDTIYNPFGARLDQAILVHEATHTKQQGDSPAHWWWRYLESPEFRFEQELEAYRNQYKAVLEGVKDRNQQFQLLRRMAVDLASPMYGDLCTVAEARKRISQLDK